MGGTSEHSLHRLDVQGHRALMEWQAASPLSPPGAVRVGVPGDGAPVADPASAAPSLQCLSS